MMKSISVVALLLLNYKSFCQSLDDLFKGGRNEYVNFIHKNAKYGDARKGRYGLCLFSFTLHVNDSVKNFRILSSPSNSISTFTLEMINRSRGHWTFPKAVTADSLNILAGLYCIQINDNHRHGKNDYPQLIYNDLYNEYSNAGFDEALPEIFTTPFIFIGIVTVKQYGRSAVE